MIATDRSRIPDCQKYRRRADGLRSGDRVLRGSQTRRTGCPSCCQSWIACSRVRSLSRLSSVAVPPEANSSRVIGRVPSPSPAHQCWPSPPVAPWRLELGKHWATLTFIARLYRLGKLELREKELLSSVEVIDALKRFHQDLFNVQSPGTDARSTCEALRMAMREEAQRRTCATWPPRPAPMDSLLR